MLFSREINNVSISYESICNARISYESINYVSNNYANINYTSINYAEFILHQFVRFDRNAIMLHLLYCNLYILNRINYFISISKILHTLPYNTIDTL